MFQKFPVSRRELLRGGAAAGAAIAGFGVPTQAAVGTIKFGVASNAWTPGFEACVAAVGKMGFDGIEPFATNVAAYRSDPARLKALLDAAGLELISCAGVGSIISSDYLDPARASQTIGDCAAFAKDFLSYFGCKHFKISIGGRRGEELMSPDQLKQISATLNEAGRRTSEYGVRLAPHPIVGSPMEREAEIRTIMDMTDPRYVGIVVDTGHVTLGGSDPLKIIADYLPRVDEVHLKDVERKYKGWTGPSYRDRTPYRVPGTANAGGVDIVAIYKLLQNRGYKGYCALDIDGFDMQGSTLDLIIANARYLVSDLKVPLKLEQ